METLLHNLLSLAIDIYIAISECLTYILAMASKPIRLHVVEGSIYYKRDLHGRSIALTVAAITETT